MENNKVYISLNPSPMVSTEDWYLGCIRDLVAELRRFEEVELVGQERLDMLKDEQTEGRILTAIQFRDDALQVAGDHLRNDDSYTYEEYKKKVAEINSAYDNWIKAIENGKPFKYTPEENK